MYSVKGSMGYDVLGQGTTTIIAIARCSKMADCRYDMHPSLIVHINHSSKLLCVPMTHRYLSIPYAIRPSGKSP